MADDDLLIRVDALGAAKVERDTAWAEVDVLRAELETARAVIRRLHDWWEPSRGRNNDGDYWRGVDDDDKFDLYEPMSAAEASLLASIQGDDDE